MSFLHKRHVTAGCLQAFVHASCTCASLSVRQMTLNNYLHVCKANYLIELVFYIKEHNRLLLQTCAACQNNKYQETDLVLVLICCNNHLIFKTQEKGAQHT